MDTKSELVENLNFTEVIIFLAEKEFPTAEAENLGEFLGLKHDTIKALESENHGCRRLLNAVVDKWLKNDAKKSWTKLTRAVKLCGEVTLAKEMETMATAKIKESETEASAAISNDNVLKVVQDHEESTSSIEGSSQQPKHTKLEPALSSLQLQKDSRLEQNKKTHLSQDTTTDQEMIASQQNLVDPEAPLPQHPSSNNELVSSVSPKDHEDFSTQLDGAVVRGYQHELAEPGLRGDNYICVAPTGTGKTLIAVLIIVSHLNRSQRKTNTHVAFIVKTKSLAEQQKLYLERKIPQARVGVCTGETKKTLTIAQSVVLNNITVCTGGEFYEELRQKKVSFTHFSMLVFDECHHAVDRGSEGSCYPEILKLFLENMLQASSLKESVQIVGFTASPGAGKNPYVEKKVALDHLKSLAAHMNASGGIKTVVDNLQELELYRNLPTTIEQYELHPRDSTNDPFIDKVLDCMRKIEKSIDFKWNENIPRWCQQYEGKIENFVYVLRQTDEEGFRDNLRASYELLNYCSALSVYMDLQKDDAIKVLCNVSNVPKDITEATDSETLYKQMREDLIAELQPLQPVKNPLLEKLESVLYNNFSKNGKSRGLIFVRTRMEARAMTDWVASNSKLKQIGISPSTITGHASGRKDGMSQIEQKEILKKFQNGVFNLLLATSVVEEGIDIPDCNLVVRYLYSSTEIKQEQAMGRARSRHSEYYSIFAASSCRRYQELKNAELIKLIHNVIHYFPNGEMFRNEISKLQQSIVKEEQQKREMLLKRKKYSGAQVELKCAYCHVPVCKGSDVKLAGDCPYYQYVVPSKDFENKYIEDQHPRLKSFSSEIYETHKIKCRKCSKEWGVKCIWSSFGKKFPVLKCSKFSFKIEGVMVETYSQWKKVPFQMELLDFQESNDDL